MKTRRWFAVSALAALGTLLAVVGFVCNFVSPKVFEAATRIKVNNDVQRRYDNWAKHPYSPFALETEFEQLQAKWTLHPVIRELVLERRWTEQRPQSPPLTVDQAYSILRQRLTISPVRSTSLLMITVWGHSPEEPALIANKIAEIYRLQKIKAEAEIATAFLNALKEQLARCDQELQGSAEESPASRDASSDRDAVQQRRAEIQKRIEFETAESARAKPGPVLIIDQAIPSLRPVRPNTFAGATFLMLGIAIDLTVLLWVTMRFEKRPLDLPAGSSLN